MREIINKAGICIVLLVLLVSCRENTQTDAERKAAIQEYKMLDSLTKNLDATTKEVESRAKGLEEALDDLN